MYVRGNRADGLSRCRYACASAGAFVRGGRKNYICMCARGYVDGGDDAVRLFVAACAAYNTGPAYVYSFYRFIRFAGIREWRCSCLAAMIVFELVIGGNGNSLFFYLAVFLWILFQLRVFVRTMVNLNYHTSQSKKPSSFQYTSNEVLETLYNNVKYVNVNYSLSNTRNKISHQQPAKPQSFPYKNAIPRKSKSNEYYTHHQHQQQQEVTQSDFTLLMDTNSLLTRHHHLRFSRRTTRHFSINPPWHNQRPSVISPRDYSLQSALSLSRTCFHKNARTSRATPLPTHRYTHVYISSLTRIHTYS